MKLGGIQTIIRANVNDAAADVDQCIIDAVNFLNNFFHIKKTDTSQTTTADQTYLTLPTGCLRVSEIEINGEFIDELVDENRLEDVDNEGVQRWYIYNDKIELTNAMTTTGEAITIWHDAEFTQPEAAVDTDVPTKLLELVYVGATYRYFGILAAKVMTSRQSFPDVSPKEILAARDDWKKIFDDLLIKLT